MKKRILPVILAFGIIITVITSCKKEESSSPSTPPVNNNNNNNNGNDTLKKPKPSVSFNSSTGFIKASDMLMAGDYFKYGIIVKSSKGEKLSRVKITVKITPSASESVVFDSTLTD